MSNCTKQKTFRKPLPYYPHGLGNDQRFKRDIPHTPKRGPKRAEMYVENLIAESTQVQNMHKQFNAWVIGYHNINNREEMNFYSEV